MRARIWDEENEMMITSQVFVVNALHGTDSIVYSDKGPVMLYTGFQENFINIRPAWRELCVSDLIEGDLYNKCVPIAGEVVYDNEHACYALKNDAGLTPLYKIANIKITGNIYEL